jgi:hypothetical protein
VWQHVGGTLRPISPLNINFYIIFYNFLKWGLKKQLWVVLVWQHVGGTSRLILPLNINEEIQINSAQMNEIRNTILNFSTSGKVKI